MNRRNLILSTDSYKASHWVQYPPNTQGLFSYIEARGKTAPNDYTVFFGLQAIIKEYLLQPVLANDVAEAYQLFESHGEPFNIAGWNRVLEKHGGYLPIKIRAVPEGSVVPNGNVLVTVESTDPELAWMASYVETLLLRLWYPTSVATRSHQCKQVIKSWLERTADNLDGLPFKLHDFGARGVSSGESAMLGGLGHLVNFLGTDTVEALVGARRYYGTPMAGFSIPAAEHSTITSWGKASEAEAYRNMLHQYGGPGKILAVVSDSYHLQQAVFNIWGDQLKQEVIDSGATVVIRPDSGDPVINVRSVAELLEARFGSTLNSKGLKVLNHVRIIQGDGIDSASKIDSILLHLVAGGFSADNVAFGMGGGLLQHVNRDTFGFAMKCSAALVDGEWRDVFKEAPGKASKRGRLELMHSTEGGYRTLSIEERPMEFEDYELKTVFDSGQLVREYTLGEIRARAA